MRSVIVSVLAVAGAAMAAVQYGEPEWSSVPAATSAPTYESAWSSAPAQSWGSGSAAPYPVPSGWSSSAPAYATGTGGTYVVYPTGGWSSKPAPPPSSVPPPPASSASPPPPPASAPPAGSGAGVVQVGLAGSIVGMIAAFAL